MPKITLYINSLTQDGHGIGRCQDQAYPEWHNMAIFVQGALPGQTVQVQINKVKSNYAEGELAGILQDNPDFGQPFCNHYGTCGGCPLQRMPYSLQLDWKAKLAKDSLKRLAKFNPDFVDKIFAAPHPSPNLKACRNKMEFAFGEDEAGTLLLGQRKAGTRKVVAIANCPLLPEGHAEILQAAIQLFRETGLRAWHYPDQRGRNKKGDGYLRYFVLRHGLVNSENGWLALCIASPGSKEECSKIRNAAQKLLAKFPNFLGFIHEERKENDHWRHGGRRVQILGSARLNQEIYGRNFELDGSSFSQVNPEGANILAKIVDEMTKPCSSGNLLDLYCGIGAPGQFLANRFQNLVGVESQKTSIACAIKNAQGPGNCSYKIAQADDFLQKNCSKSWQTILVDPPRAGLGEKVTNHILKIKAEQLIYISCNPVTFARDAALLNKVYELKQMASVDLFPHTPHLECCSRWERRDAS